MKVLYNNELMIIIMHDTVYIYPLFVNHSFVGIVLFTNPIIYMWSYYAAVDGILAANHRPEEDVQVHVIRKLHVVQISWKVTTGDNSFKYT